MAFLIITAWAAELSYAAIPFIAAAGALIGLASGHSQFFFSQRLLNQVQIQPFCRLAGLDQFIAGHFR